jgi:ceramide glucosyltransferase
VAQLAAAPAGREELVVIADSDLRITDETLPALVGVLASDPQAGASHAAQIERRADTVGDQASAALLSSTPHAFLCLAALAERNGREQAMCGALVAIRRTILDEVGGFASLEEFLGEDFELARRIHRLGKRAPISPEPVEAVAAGRPFSNVASRFARWSTVTRTQKPHLYVTYLLLLGCAPPLFVLTALTAVLQPPLWWFGLGWAALFFLARTTLAAMLRRRAHLPAGPVRSLAALLLGETLLLIGATGGLGRPIIEWRGHRFRIEKGGKMLRL